MVRRARGDSGSILVASAAIAILATLGAVILDRTMATSRATLAEQKRAAAIAVADYAVTAVVARIDLGESATFTDSGTVSGVAWSATATKVDIDNWTVAVAAGVAPSGRKVFVSVNRQSGTGFKLNSWRETGV